MEKTQKYYAKLAIAQRAIEDLIFDRVKRGKVVLFIDPTDNKKEFITRIETLVVE